MLRPRCALVLSLSLFTAAMSPAQARAVRIWSASELTKAADVIVIAEVRSTIDHNAVVDNSRAKADTWVPVDSAFDVKAVLKGNFKGSTVTVHHFRYSDKSAETLISDGPGFVEFNPVNKNEYLIYLKKGTNGAFEPLTGQMDPWVSFYLVQPFSTSQETIPSGVSR